MLMLGEPPVIDKKTRKRVERFSTTTAYIFFKSRTISLKITGGFSMVPPATTNAFRSSTESTAIKRIEWEPETKCLLEKVQRAVNRLPYNERQIIIKRYMRQRTCFRLPGI
ncbi:ArpU family phage packaging/lysis transcriptional regulator [Bacillus sp. SL00103]